MQQALRLAVCLVVAAASSPVFAGAGDEEATAEQGAAMEQQGSRSDEIAAEHDAGSGGREPAAAESRGDIAPGDPVRTAGAPSDDATERWAHQKFLEEVWAPNP